MLPWDFGEHILLQAKQRLESQHGQVANKLREGNVILELLSLSQKWDLTPGMTLKMARFLAESYQILAEPYPSASFKKKFKKEVPST